MTTSAGDDLRPALDPARAHVRDLIRQEVAARRPRAIARRTVELLTESAVEPAPGTPAYRIVDRHGEPRLRDAEDGPAQPLTLAEFLSELEARHPALFEPSPPASAPVAEGQAQTESTAAQALRLRDDTARYIELQSAKARVITRAVAASSSARGRSLAAAATATVATLRGQAQDWRRRATAQASSTIGPERAPDADAGLRPATVPLGDRLRMGAGDIRARGRDILGRGGDLLDARWVLGAATVAAVLVAAVVLVGTEREADTPASDAPAQGSVPAPPARPPQTPPVTSPVPSPSDPVADAGPAQPARPAGSSAPAPETQPTPSPPPSPEPGDDEAEVQPLPGEVSGPAEVVDTATLRIGGKLLHLFGVEWVRGGQSQDLTRYLAGRPVNCQRAPGSENHVCTVEGRDLSEVVLFNGGGRASPEASPDLVAAEDHARTERLGVWKR